MPKPSRELVSLWRLPFVHGLLPLSLACAALAAIYIGLAIWLGAGPLYVVGVLALNVFYWTFIEYLLHRWVLHWEPTSPTWKLLRKSFPPHRPHHKHPERPRGNELSEWVYVLILSPLTTLTIMVVPWHTTQYGLLAGAGVMIGYFGYEYVHAACHLSPMRGRFLSRIKRFHAIHHYRDETINFGVTTSMWDYVFRTHHTQQAKTLEA